MILYEFFLALLLSFFSAALSSLPFALHISDRRKKLIVNYGQSLEIGSWSIIGTMGLFITIFAPKADHVSFHLLRGEAVSFPKWTVIWIYLS